MARKFVVLLLLLAFVFLGAPMATAQTGQPGIKLTVNNLSGAGNQVSGQVALQNLSSLQYPQLLFNIALYSPGVTKNIGVQGARSTTTSKGLLVSYTSKELSLDNLGSTEIPFQLPYNPKLQSGNYSVVASLQTTDGDILGYTSGSLNLQTENTGFSIDPFSCEIVVNKTRYNPADGPLVGPNDNAFLECSVKNLSTQNASVQAIPGIDYAVRSVIETRSDQVKQQVGPDPIAFNPSQEKKVQFKIPALVEPQVYEGYAYIMDNAKVKISPAIAFRWIVSGASAYIESVNLDKDRYKANETIQAAIVAYPSMDYFWQGRGNNGIPLRNSRSASSSATQLQNAYLKVTVADQSGSQCATKEVPLPDSNVAPADWAKQSVQLISNKDCTYPVVTTEINYDGKTLATMTKEIPVLIAPDVERKQQITLLIAGILAVVFGIVAVIAGVIFYRRRKKGRGTPPPPPQHPNAPVPPLAVILTLITLGTLLLMPSVVSAQESSSSAVVKPPVNNPISAHNIVIKRGMTGNETGQLEDNTYVNYTNFVQVDPSGSSSITTDAQCGGAKLKLVGHSSNEYVCSNKKSGIRYIITIDGQPATISNVTSPDSNVTINTAGPNSFDVWEFAGVRTAELDVNLAGGIPSGHHQIDVKVIGLGLTDLNHNTNFYEVLFTSVDDLSSRANLASLYPQYPAGFWDNVPDSQLNNCDSKGECYGLLSYQWACDNGNRCNETCERDDQCAGATKDGCTVCLPNDNGTKTCQPPAACGTSCTDRADCASATKDGCTECLPNDSGTGSVCSQPPACNVSCTRDGQCEGAKDGCTSCLPSDTGDGNVCRPPAACGVSCTRDDQCAGATRDGCTVCAPNGSGQNVCQPPFSTAMCKCDGFNALNLQNPSNSNFEFEAFAKVEGKDISAAQVKDMKFTLYKSAKSDPNNATPIASGTIVPQIVSTTADKIRYRAVWSVTPPAFDPNAIYRVGAEPTCVRKTATASASLNLSTTNLLSSDNSKVLGTELNYSPATLTQNNLQLGTLEDGYFTRITETDSCRFIRFEYGQY